MVTHHVNSLHAVVSTACCEACCMEAWLVRLQSTGVTAHWMGEQSDPLDQTRAPQDCHCRLCFRQHEFGAPHARDGHVRAASIAL